MVRWGVDAIRVQALHTFDASYSWHLQCWWCHFILDPLSSPIWFTDDPPTSSSVGFMWSNNREFLDRSACQALKCGM